MLETETGGELIVRICKAAIMKAGITDSENAVSALFVDFKDLKQDGETPEIPDPIEPLVTKYPILITYGLSSTEAYDAIGGGGVEGERYDINIRARSDPAADRDPDAARNNLVKVDEMLRTEMAGEPRCQDFRSGTIEFAENQTDLGVVFRRIRSVEVLPA